MMDMNWQVIVAVSVVGIAVWHLLRRTVAMLRAPGRHSCGGCSNCPDPVEKQETSVDLHQPVDLYEIAELRHLGEVPPRAATDSHRNPPSSQ